MRIINYITNNFQYVSNTTDNKLLCVINYSTFGSLMPGRQYSSGTGYRFGFNGQEIDNEVVGLGNTLDFGARIYDSRLGSFKSIDPLYIKFPCESNYIFAGNSPIQLIDIKGQYKYPAKQAVAYTKSYPMLTKYLSQNVKNDVLNSQTILNGMLKYSGGNLTKGEVEKAVTWGNGASIVYNEDLLVNEDGTGFYGRYDASTNTINISKNFADKVESILGGKGSEETKIASLYEFFATITHKTVHQGDYMDGSRQDADDPSGFGGEPGSAFMQDVFESKDVKVDGENIKVYQGSVHGDSKELVKMQEAEEKKDVIPTLPQTKEEPKK